MHAISSFRSAHPAEGTHLASLEVDDFTHSKIGIRISIRVTKSLENVNRTDRRLLEWRHLRLSGTPSSNERDERHVPGKFAKELSEELVVSGRINLGRNEVKREPYVAV